MVSRRQSIALAGGAVAAAAGATAFGVAHTRDEPSPPTVSDAVEFYGPHQAGIVTPAQDRLHFVAFDVITEDRAKLVALLREWTAAAADMTAGREVGPHGAVGGKPEAPPHDTGEAIGLPSAALTLTIGFGPSLFGRFGLAQHKPRALAELPHFPGDALKPEISGGDLCVQACANDPQVAVHAVRNLARIGFGVVSVRYSQLGFGRTSSTSRAQITPRNLMSFKDGTANLKLEDTALLKDHLAGGDHRAEQGRGCPATSDVLNEYIRHVSSGLWAVPPGVATADDYWGSSLFS